MKSVQDLLYESVSDDDDDGGEYERDAGHTEHAVDHP
eukprot:CAMPEP_0202718150 /NCGR_PEP_ID=MMETSP1385-20130828/119149_1 /ASSEMBLY_ACC=CAM_ASM_000861 /TAXON_ID=933848 /ORGANISM="Elphidium margaritaceum" /LENGTH=36 /DNA_ID= /DNA_START= /DNA_END= /DNA_ORIENTATION=